MTGYLEALPSNEEKTDNFEMKEKPPCSTPDIDPYGVDGPSLIK